jgi:predicted nucleic-acid-binding protein
LVVIDTNIVVRLLTGDDKVQTERARNLLASQSVILLQTVALEVEWVLRSAFRYKRGDVVAGLRAFCALPQVEVENTQRLSTAIDLFATGFDFADALHLSAVGPEDTLVTFDAAFAKAAKVVPGMKVRQL